MLLSLKLIYVNQQKYTLNSLCKSVIKGRGEMKIPRNVGILTHTRLQNSFTLFLILFYG